MKINVLKVIAFFVELINWFRIVLSPTILGVILGLLIHASSPNINGKILCLALGCIGLIIGIIWACRTWKRGTSNFISKIDSSSDLDQLK